MVDRLKRGFSLDCEAGELRDETSHSKTTRDNPEIVREYLEEEINAGSMFGPFRDPPLEDLHLNRINLKPKHETIDPNKPRNNQYRIIVDLSSPEGASVNTYIEDEDATVSYVKLDEVFDRLVEMGPGTLLFKIDIERAYRILPVRKEDRRLLGIKFEEEYFVDATLPFGGRSCAKIFNAFGDVVCYAWERGCEVSCLVHYLDDFFGWASRGAKREAIRDFERMIRRAEEWGIPLSEKKKSPLSTVEQFLGFEIETEGMTVSVPEEKRLRYLDTLTSRKITIKPLGKR